MDEKSSDGTFELLNERIGRGSEVRWLPNRASTIIENVIEFMSKDAGTPWVLRIDDDELPSTALLRFCKEAVEQPHADVYAFLLHQCIVTASGRLFALREAPGPHRRLYCVNRVCYTDRVHSAGFEEGTNLAVAPEEACRIHLDWVVHSYAERKAKVERYDAHTTGSGTAYRDLYLFEERGLSANQLKAIDLPEFHQVCRVLAARFPERCASDLDGTWPAGRNTDGNMQ